MIFESEAFYALVGTSFIMTRDELRKSLRLQDDEQRSALDKVKSQLEKAEREYARQERLHAQELISETAGLAYPIRDGIPIMLQDEARVLKDKG